MIEFLQYNWPSSNARIRDVDTNGKLKDNFPFNIPKDEIFKTSFISHVLLLYFYNEINRRKENVIKKIIRDRKVTVYYTD